MRLRFMWLQFMRFWFMQFWPIRKRTGRLIYSILVRLNRFLSMACCRLGLRIVWP